MYEADRPVSLLYLINVMQPVPLPSLQKRFHRLTARVRSSGVRQEDVNAILNSLRQHRLVSKKADKYSVTVSGLRKLTSFGFGRVRDKNRLFFLNKLL